MNFKIYIIYIIFLFILIPACLQGQSFITTWNTANPGTSSSTSIEIPTGAGVFDYDVDWDNDGVFDELNINGSITHDFGAEGIYTIRIQGEFPSIQFNNGGDKDKIIDITQWGNIQWESFENAFQGCSNLNATATDSPDLTNVLNYSFAFQLANQFNGDLSNWDVSAAKNMRGMFWGASAFNSNVSNWNVANVTDMSFMFFLASVFNIDLNTWDVSSVGLMSQMFSSASNFNGDVSTWNPAIATDMSFMFSNASVFDQDIGGWNIPMVIDMTGMLDNTAMSIENYDNTLIGWSNQAVNNNVALSANGLEYCGGESARFTLTNGHNWTISGDAHNCPYFIIQFDTSLPGASNATSAILPTIGGNYSVDWNNDGLFDEHNLSGNTTHDFGVAGIYTIMIRGDFPRIYFNNSGDKDKITSVIKWGENQWETMNSAFYGCNNLVIIAADNPDLSNVTDMSSMFRSAMNFAGSLANWDVSSVTDMSDMFNGASSFNSVLSNWNVSSIQDLSGMFLNASEFNNSLGGWSIGNVQDMTDMLSDCGMTTINYDNTIIGWALQNVQNNISLDAQNLTYCNSEGARNLLINQENWTINGDSKECAFVTSWKTDNPGESNATSITIPTFQGETYNYNVDWENDGVIDVFGVTGDITHNYGVAGTYEVSISGQFPRIYFNADEGDAEKIIDLISWGNIEWTSMELAFYGCDNMDVSATDAPDLSNVTNMHGMFVFAGLTNPNFTNWDVSTITNMDDLFLVCSTFNGDISNWDVSNVTSMRYLFEQTDLFNGDLSSWIVSNVTNMDGMFDSALAFNMPIGNWDVSNVTNMGRMFRAAGSFNQDLSLWDVSNVELFNSMFSDASSFNQDLGNWEILSATSLDFMLKDCGLSTHNYDNLLIGWNMLDLPQNLNFGAQGMTYCEGVLAHFELIVFKQWTILGDKGDCSFRTTWKTDNPGSSPNDAITIPTIGGGYNYDVDWNNDGVFDQFGINGSVSHIYPQPGTYTIRIQGDFPRIYFNDEGDKEKIINIDQWGDNDWTSMNNAFKGCINLNATAYDEPDLLDVSDMSSMFYNAESFNGDVSLWNVHFVTNMELLFFHAESFNGDVSMWDVSNVVNMRSMFNNAESFSGDVSLWDVSNVEDMILIFRDTDVFNSEMSNWVVSNVTTMAGMFFGATIFDRDIGDWVVSNVTDMSSMFVFADSFNQDIGDWDVSNVIDMEFMFFSANEFNQNISTWNVSSVEDMSGVFKGATVFNQDLSNWNVSNATEMNQMFLNADSFNQDLGEWDVTGVTDMEDMLSNCGVSQENYDQTLIGWAALNVNQNVVFDADNLMYCAGENARNNLINNFGWLINGDSKSCPLAFTTTWKTDNPGTSNATSITIPASGAGLNYHVDWNNDGVYDETNVTGSITHDYGVVGNYTVAITGAFPRIAFNNSGDKEKLLYINQWSDNAWSTMQNAFYGCTNLQITALDLPNLSNVESTGSMFRAASSLNSGLNGWDLSNVTSTTFMFADALVFNQSLDSWDVSNVENMSYMFYNAADFNGNISSWNVGEVTNMYGLFWNASSFNQNIGNWNTQNVTDMRKVFESATAFNQNLGSWNITNVSQMNSMLDLSGLILENYDNTLIGWSSQNVKPNVSLGAEGLEYCAAQDNREGLINDDSWIISDDILGCAPCGIISWIGGMDTWMISEGWDLDRLPLPCDDVVINQGGHVTLPGGNNPTVNSVNNQGILILKTGSKLEIIEN